MLVTACILTSVLSGCDNTQPPKNTPLEQTTNKADQIVDQAEKDISNKSGIEVPTELKQITPTNWAKFERINCTNESFTDICDYYIQIKNSTGEKSIKNLQWNSFCAYVKKYGITKKFTTGDYDYETLGYEEKACHQGMYKTK